MADGVVQGEDFPTRTHVFMASTANQKFRQTTNTSSDEFMQLESRWLYDDECTAVLEEKYLFFNMRSFREKNFSRTRDPHESVVKLVEKLLRKIRL